MTLETPPPATATCAGKGGRHTPECKERLEKILKEERLAQKSAAAASQPAATAAPASQRPPVVPTAATAAAAAGASDLLRASSDRGYDYGFGLLQLGATTTNRRRHDLENVWKYFGFELSQELGSVEVVEEDGARPWLCLTPGCEFRVHSDPKFGCWCCKACARAFSDAGGDRDRMWSDYDERWWPVHHGTAGPLCTFGATPCCCCPSTAAEALKTGSGDRHRNSRFVVARCLGHGAAHAGASLCQCPL